MAKYKRRAEKRLSARIKGYDSVTKNKGGYHKPGSLKKAN